MCKKTRRPVNRVSPFKCPCCSEYLIFKKMLKVEDVCPSCHAPMIIRNSFTVNGQLRMKKYTCTNHDCDTTKSTYDEIQLDADLLHAPEKSAALYLCEGLTCNAKYFVSVEEPVKKKRRVTVHKIE